MEGALFDKRPIAVIWDFDKTLIPGSMQKPLFEHYKVDEGRFWKEADGLFDFYRQRGLEASEDTLYLGHILSYVRAGRFTGLSNGLLRELGAKLTFYEGLPDFFASCQTLVEDNPIFTELGIQVEHYIVSTGFRQMILGSPIAEFVTGVWACEFAEIVPGPDYLLEAGDGSAVRPEAEGGGEIKDIVYTINNTTKTRAIFEINKGVNADSRIDVNAQMAAEDRRVPFENMIYIADGPSDVPVFSVVKQYGGQTFGVYKPADPVEFARASRLARQGRIDAFAEADYRLGRQAAMWIEEAITRMAERMVEARNTQREHDLSVRVGAPPRHGPSEDGPIQTSDPETERSTGELGRQ